MGQGVFDAIFAGPTGIASTLLNIFGGTGILSYSTGDTYTPTTGVTVAGTAVSDTVDVSPPDPYHRRDIDGTAVKQGDMKVIIPAAQCTARPPVNSTFTYASEAWNVESVNPIISGTEVAAYALQLRK